MGIIFIRNVWVRTLSSLILMGFISISANCLVVEATINNKILWSLMPHKLSFYILLISMILLAFYQVAISKYDNNLTKGFTPKQYEAAIRNKVAEKIAKRSRKLIQGGEIDQLEQETKIFKKLYGESNQ